jgi:hypothetical protein
MYLLNILIEGSFDQRCTRENAKTTESENVFIINLLFKNPPKSSLIRKELCFDSGSPLSQSKYRNHSVLPPHSLTK